MTTEQLHHVVSQHLEEAVSKKTGRDQLLDAARQLHLVPDDILNAPAPKYHGTTVLQDMLRKSNYKGAIPTLRKELLNLCKEHGLIDDEVFNAKVSRPDKAAKMIARRDYSEFSRQCSLSRLFRGLKNKETILETIKTITLQMSKIVHQRSFLVWLHLRRLIDSGEPFPDLLDSNAVFFRHCFTVGVTGATSTNIPLSTTLTMYKNLFPTLQLPRNACNVVSHAARTYRTAFVNHFTLLDKVLGRVNKLASRIIFGIEPLSVEEKALRIELYGENPIYNILCAVETGKIPANAVLANVITEIRNDIGIPENTVLTQLWLEKNIEKSVRFGLKVCKHVDACKDEAQSLMQQSRPVTKGATKGLKWVPTNTCKLHFIRLDATDLARLLALEKVDGISSLELVQSTFRKNIKELFGDKFAHALDDPLRQSKDPSFTGTIDTNGNAVSIHFTKLKIKRRKDEMADDRDDPPTAHSTLARDDEAGQSDQTDREPSNALPNLMLLVDPGRINIVTMTVFHEGKPFFIDKTSKTTGKVRQKRLVFKLTGKQYYSVSGIRTSTLLQKRRRSKHPRLQQLDALKFKSTTGLKTARLDSIEECMKAMNKYSDDAWRFAASPKTLKEAFRSSAGKQRARTTFFASVMKRLTSLFGKQAAQDATVIWGSAKVSPSGRGNLTVPTSGIAKDAARI